MAIYKLHSHTYLSNKQNKLFEYLPPLQITSKQREETEREREETLYMK